MGHSPVQIVTTAAEGRLAAPEAFRPLSVDGFNQLMERWRAARVWLSLWGRDGELILHDAQAGRLWPALWNGGEAFRNGLRSFVREQQLRFMDDDRPAEAVVEFGPWAPDLGLIVAPIRQRTRCVGAVVGGMVMSPQPGENFARLCDQCGLDRGLLLRLAAQAGVVPLAEAAGLAGLLRLSVGLLRESETRRDEISVLTGNLEGTYEELSLVYEISARLRLEHPPNVVLEDVAREVLEVSRASAIGFVLNDDAEHGRAALPTGGITTPTTAASGPVRSRIIQIGPGAPDNAHLARLASCLPLHPDQPVSQLVINRVAERPELRWAGSWLKHLVVLPLWHDRQLLGVVLAMNCTDRGDFTSIDVQLLKAVADRLAAFLANQRLYADLADLLMGLLHALVNSIDAKDPYTCGHSERVAYYSRALAAAAGLDPRESDRVYLAGLLHDVGKIGVPDAILSKPGKLTVEEFTAMKKHPEIGARILGRVRQIADLVPGVLYHHERVDGRGYPRRMAGRDIPLLGRIICLADCFDAMTTSRTYRKALPLPVAVAEIRRCSGTQFDPELAELFLGLDLPRLMGEAREFAEGRLAVDRIAALNVEVREARMVQAAVVSPAAAG